MFSDWLKEQLDRDDAVGDIAKDYVADAEMGCVPKAATYKTVWRHMLEEHSPCAGALDALTDAFHEYRGSPTLLAYKALNYEGWQVWCKYCRVWHTHSPGEGHRVAHCGDVELRNGKLFSVCSPYREGGYILKYAGERKRRSRKTQAI